MAQNETLDVLKKLSKICNRWYTSTEIYAYMIDNKIMEHGITSRRKLTRDLYKLSVSNLIECKGVGLWNHFKVFKYKA